MKIVFSPNKPEKLIDSYDASTQYKIQVDEVKIHVPVGELAPSIFTNYMNHLPKEVAVLAFKRLVVHIMSIPKGTTNYQSYNLFSSDIPAR